MDSDDLAFAGAAAQAQLIRSGEVSARELVQATLDRIDSQNASLNAYCQIFGDEALENAAAIDRQKRRDDPRPLLGVPVAIKDSTDVAGRPTGWGAKRNDVPQTADAHAVARLRSAGAVIVGKTTCSELTIQPFTETEAFGTTHNPWDPSRTPGGSSGGAGAAAAAGLCGVALGSDGLGSIRIPAAFCGLFGLKPQRERVPTGPRSVGGWHGLSAIGPLARHVADAAAFLDATADDQPEGGYLSGLNDPISPLRIALSWQAYPPLSLTAKIGAPQRRAVESIAGLLRSLGHEVFEQEVDLSPALFFNIGARYFRSIAEDLETLPHPELVERRTKTMARLGRSYPVRLFERALAAEPAISRRANAIFEQADVVVTPAVLAAPWPIGAFDGLGALRTLDKAGKVVPHFAPWNVIGQPAMVVPVGFDADGLPLAAQFYGRANDESTLLRLAAQLEEATPWATHRPKDLAPR